MTRSGSASVVRRARRPWALRRSVSALHGIDWVRLPGLFRWSEVCDLARDIQQNDEWCFAVRLVSVGPHAEPLYVVDAGSRRKKATH